MKYKYEYNCYAPYQYEDLQDHLEQMAVRGWILERMDYHFLVYRRGGTQLTRYALAYHPEVGDMDHPRAPRLEIMLADFQHMTAGHQETARDSAG